MLGGIPGVTEDGGMVGGVPVPVGEELGVLIFGIEGYTVCEGAGTLLGLGFVGDAWPGMDGVVPVVVFIGDPVGVFGIVVLLVLS